MSGPRVAGIVGLGLMGGSLARDLAASGWRVLAADTDAATLGAAMSDGVVAGPLRVEDVDLLVLAVPVRAAPDVLRELAPQLPAAAVVTDLGSTKRSIVQAAAALGLRRFVGSHPMAGDHRSGWTASRSDLYQGARVWLCHAGADPDAVEMITGLWQTLGARPEQVDAAAHDWLLAYASHLPQAVASALGSTLAKAGVAPDRLGPGGRDSTRLAGSDPRLWRDILVDNGDLVGEALDRLIEELEALRRAMAQRDAAGVEAAVEAGRRWSHST